MKVLYLALAGGAGTLCRYGIGALLNRDRFPFGTLTVNVVGCLLMGLVLGLNQSKAITDDVRIILAVGFLGAFTTFSAFEAELWSLGDQKRFAAFSVYLFGSLALGLLAVVGGRALGMRFATG